MQHSINITHTAHHEPEMHQPHPKPQMQHIINITRTAQQDQEMYQRHTQHIPLMQQRLPHSLSSWHSEQPQIQSPTRQGHSWCCWSCMHCSFVQPQAPCNLQGPSAHETAAHHVHYLERILQVCHASPQHCHGRPSRLRVPCCCCLRPCAAVQVHQRSRKVPHLVCNEHSIAGPQPPAQHATVHRTHGCSSAV